MSAIIGDVYHITMTFNIYDAFIEPNGDDAAKFEQAAQIRDELTAIQAVMDLNVHKRGRIELFGSDNKDFETTPIPFPLALRDSNGLAEYPHVEKFLTDLILKAITTQIHDDGWDEKYLLKHKILPAVILADSNYFGLVETSHGNPIVKIDPFKGQVIISLPRLLTSFDQSHGENRTLDPLIADLQKITSELSTFLHAINLETFGLNESGEFVFGQEVYSNENIQIEVNSNTGLFGLYRREQTHLLAIGMYKPSEEDQAEVAIIRTDSEAYLTQVFNRIMHYPLASKEIAELDAFNRRNMEQLFDIRLSKHEKLPPVMIYLKRKDFNNIIESDKVQAQLGLTSNDAVEQALKDGLITVSLIDRDDLISRHNYGMVIVVKRLDKASQTEFNEYLKTPSFLLSLLHARDPLFYSVAKAAIMNGKSIGKELDERVSLFESDFEEDNAVLKRLEKLQNSYEKIKALAKLKQAGQINNSTLRKLELESFVDGLTKIIKRKIIDY